MFLKEHLLNQYNWASENGQAFFNGSPSRRLFNRFNGDQVLFIINNYGSAHGDISIEEGRKLEQLLLHSLPLEAKSEITVINWLKEVVTNDEEKIGA